MKKYYKLYKPYGYLSQFSGSGGERTLGELFNFQKDIYPVGRLDKDSEGLLILTNDASLNSYLLNPLNKAEKEYLVQVEGNPSYPDIKPLMDGVEIEGRKTLPAKVEVVSEPQLPPRNPPIRFRKTIPDSWLKVIITEGKNRQVRKMTAKIGFPALRLIRIRIKNITLGDMQPGEVKELTTSELKKLKSA